MIDLKGDDDGKCEEARYRPSEQKLAQNRGPRRHNEQPNDHTCAFYRALGELCGTSTPIVPLCNLPGPLPAACCTFLSSAPGNSVRPGGRPDSRGGSLQSRPGKYYPGHSRPAEPVTSTQLWCPALPDKAPRSCPRWPQCSVGRRVTQSGLSSSAARSWRCSTGPGTDCTWSFARLRERPPRAGMAAAR